MKVKSFLQAGLIVLLLCLSWLLLLNRIQSRTDAPAEQETAPVEETAREQEAEEDVNLREDPDLDKPKDLDLGEWREWIAYLEAAESPAGMRAALHALHEGLIGMAAEDARAFLLKLIRSEADMRTGLAFEMAAGGHLRGAHSLRAIALDWLAAIDPAAAADFARDELRSLGTDLVPDVFAIHLRNLTRGELPAYEVDALLQLSLGRLLEHEPWLQRPRSAVAEAFDLAVYLQAFDRVPELTALLGTERPGALRKAAGLAIERLTDRDPLAVLPDFLENSLPIDALAADRAQLFSRVVPIDPARQDLLENYLRDPRIRPAEKADFLKRFPNLDQTVSFNLLSSNYVITQNGSLQLQLEAAELAITEWLRDPALAPLQKNLHSVLDRLQQQLE